MISIVYKKIGIKMPEYKIGDAVKIKTLRDVYFIENISREKNYSLSSFSGDVYENIYHVRCKGGNLWPVQEKSIIGLSKTTKNLSDYYSSIILAAALVLALIATIVLIILDNKGLI